MGIFSSVAIIVAATALLAVTFRWILRCPVRGIYLTMLALPLLILHLNLPLLAHRITLVDLFIVMTAVAWAWRRFTKSQSPKEPLIFEPKIYIPLLLFYLAGLLSFKNTLSYTWSIVELTIYLYLGLFFFIFTQVVRRGEELRKIIHLWAVAAGVVIAFGIVQLLSVYTGWGGGWLLWGEGEGRITSTFVFSNQPPSYLISVFPLFLLWSLKKSKWARLGSILLALGAVAVMLGTGSRTALLLVLVSLILFILWRSLSVWRLGELSKRGLLIRVGVGILVLVLIAGAVLAVKYDVYGVYSRLKDFPIRSIGRAFSALETFNLRVADLTRYYQWQGVFQAVREHPLVGVGVGSFRFYLPQYIPEAEGWEVHNTFLGVLAETGILGLLSLLAFLFVILAKGKRIPFDLQDRYWSLEGGALVLGFLCNIIIYGSFMYGLRQRHLWAGLGLIVAISTVMGRGGHAKRLA